MQAILLAAGLGKRMAPLTPGLPKPLLPVAGRSLLQRALDGLAAAGVTRCVVVLHHGEAALRKELRAWGGPMHLVPVRQAKPRGTGDAVATGTRRLQRGDDQVLVAMADGLLPDADLRRLAKSKGFTVAAAKVPDASRYGRLEVAGRRLRGLREKPKGAKAGLVNTGFYLVPRAALAETSSLRPSPRGELEFTDVVRRWAKSAKVTILRVEGWIDVGAPWDLLAAQEALLPATLDALLGKKRRGGRGTIEPGVEVRGRLWVAEGSVVKSGTYVEGDCLVGPGSKVGPNAYLRGPVAIGAGCHVGASTEIKASVLMDGANAPHLNYVGDSVLGPGCNLGAGTITANLKVTPGTVRATGPSGRIDTGRRKFGAVLGPAARTGILCSLDPGTLVGEGALVGAGQRLSGWVEPGSRRLPAGNRH